MKKNSNDNQGIQEAFNLIQYIANDIPELSQEKIKNQRNNYQKQAHMWMNLYWNLVNKEKT